MLRRIATICVAMAVIVTACGIPENGQVSRIQDNNLGPLDDTIPTTSTSTPPTSVEPTTTTTPLSTSTTIATEDVTLYFISGGILTAFTSTLPKHASANQVLAALQDGPPKNELGAGLRTAVPPRNQAALSVTEDGSGVASVDLPSNFYDTPALANQDDQRLAIGQIVLTLTEVGRIGQVRFTQAGVPVGVPRGSRELSEPGEALPPRDYEELLQSPVVPETTTTTATTTAPPAETTVP